MRTTVRIEDDLLALVSQHAKLRRKSLSQAISDLIRRGLHAPTRTRERNGLVIFDIPKDSPPVTAQTVRHLEAEL